MSSGSKPTKADLIAFINGERLAASTVPVLETICAILRRSDKPGAKKPRATKPRVQFAEAQPKEKKEGT
jgi:hypothetical protein